MVPDRLWADARLDHLDVRLWCVLAFIARGRDQCDPTDATLASKLRISDRTVRRSLDRLHQAGYIERQRVGESRVITLKPTGDGEEITEFNLRVMAG